MSLPPDPADFLLDGHSPARYERDLISAIGAVSATFAECDATFSGIDHEALRREVDAVDLQQPTSDCASALRELDRLYLRDAVYFHHPRYLAHLNCPVVLPALAADAVASAVNSSLDTWDQSAGGTLIEQRLIQWTCDRLGFDAAAADGIFTSGGTQSNLHALYLAREHAVGSRHATDRTAALPRLRVFASADSHFSVRTAARLLGLHPDAVVPIPTDGHRRLRVDALRAAIDSARAEGSIPMAVVATAGTTDFGVIDPLAEIAEVVHEQPAPLWLHVDAAYGGGLLVSPTRRSLLAGIERAHSATVDFHKSFFQPISASALLVRRSEWMDAGRHHADYLNPVRMTRAGIPNQVDKSLQTTRRFDALKLWLTLRVMGADAIGELFDRVIDRAGEAHRLVASDPRFEVVTPSDLSTVVFRFAGTDEANLAARAALSANAEAMIASTTVDGRTFLKFTLLNPRTTLADIAEVVALIAGYASEHLSAQPSLAS
ncbi:aspartate aminotransferase family protein [Flexivirga sp. ID2601S]|uniref:Aspartate aminotransferase family protein n=1 Tax=Flexivirga aerilata TaxID=1656889 RepID=A0A849AED1_9MICO|nr:aspartate aminotransferase family protein [Flexivirga aerilata]NNG39224.1 aspartate aminotransferase family protein [Flexivirga aerilata]